MPSSTPGPWTTGANPTRVESEHEHGWANDGWIVCDCKGPDALANARLIASAPDLLAVLKRVLGNTERAEAECRLDGFGYCYTHTSAFPCLVEQMRAAIAKAEGRDFPPQKEEE